MQIRRILELYCQFAANNAVLRLTIFWQIKRGRENQSLIKKSMLRLVVTTSGEEYYELSKDEPGAVPSPKNYTGCLDGSENHVDGKIFSSSCSETSPV